MLFSPPCRHKCRFSMPAARLNGTSACSITIAEPAAGTMGVYRTYQQHHRDRAREAGLSGHEQAGRLNETLACIEMERLVLWFAGVIECWAWHQHSLYCCRRQGVLLQPALEGRHGSARGECCAAAPGCCSARGSWRRVPPASFTETKADVASESFRVRRPATQACKVG